MAYHQARKAKDQMDEAERRAIAESEAAELASITEAAVPETSEGAAATGNGFRRETMLKLEELAVSHEPPGMNSLMHPVR